MYIYLAAAPLKAGRDRIMSKLTIGHLSDMHLIGEKGAEGTMLKLKDAGGDPQGSLERCLKELAEERPDLLLITGDMCHEGTAADYDGLRETIEKHLLSIYQCITFNQIS